MSFNKYKIRRNTLRATIALPIVAVAVSQLPSELVIKPKSVLNPQYSTLTTGLEEVDLAEKLLHKELSSAKENFSTQNGFKGYRPDKSTLAATSKTSIVLAKIIESSCYFIGFIPGEEERVIKDPTLEACQEDKIEKLSQALRSQDNAIIKKSYQQASIELKDRAEEAVYAYLGKLGQSYEGVAKVLKYPDELIIANQDNLTIRSISTGLCWELSVNVSRLSDVRSCRK
jgi:hypothetical protein